MICPICESGMVRDWFCSRCDSYFWKDARGLITSGNILEMHTALLKADCIAVEVEKVESNYHQLCMITRCVYNANNRCNYKLKCVEVSHV